MNVESTSPTDVSGIEKQESNHESIPVEKNASFYTTDGTNSTASSDLDEPFDVTIQMRNSELGPDDEMYPSTKDGGGCNLLAPVYNLQGICGVRGRVSSPTRSLGRDEYIQDGIDDLDDGDLPTLAVKKKPSNLNLEPNVVEELPVFTKTTNEDERSQMSTASVQLKAPRVSRVEMEKARNFWSQLESDTFDSANEEAKQKRTKQDVKKRNPKSSKKKNIVSDDEKSGKIKNRNIAKKQQTKKTKNKKKKSASGMSGTFWDMMGMNDESGDEDNKKPSTGDNICSLAQELTDGLVTAICGNESKPVQKRRERHVPRYLNLDTSDMVDYEHVAIEVEFVEDDLTESSLEDPTDYESGSFLQLGPDGAMNVVTESTRARSPPRVIIANIPQQKNISKEERNSRLGSMSKRAKREFSVSKSQSRDEDDVIANKAFVSKESLKDLPQENNVRVLPNRAYVELPSMAGWPKAKKDKYNELLKEGYSMKECEVMVNEMDDYETDLESLDSKASKKSKSLRLFRKKKKKKSLDDSGSVSSAASSTYKRGKKMMSKVFKRKSPKDKGGRKFVPQDDDDAESLDKFEREISNLPIDAMVDSVIPPSKEEEEEKPTKAEKVVPPPVSIQYDDVTPRVNNVPPSRSMSSSDQDEPSVERKAAKRSKSPLSTRFDKSSSNNAAILKDESRKEIRERSRELSHQPSRSISPMDKSSFLTNFRSKSQTRSQSAPRAGGQTEPLSANTHKPIPGVDDLLKSSLSWDRFEPEKVEEEVKVRNENRSKKWGDVETLNDEVVEEESAVYFPTNGDEMDALENNDDQESVKTSKSTTSSILRKGMNKIKLRKSVSWSTLDRDNDDDSLFDGVDDASILSGRSMKSTGSMRSTGGILKNKDPGPIKKIDDLFDEDSVVQREKKLKAEEIVSSDDEDKPRVSSSRGAELRKLRLMKLKNVRDAVAERAKAKAKQQDNGNKEDTLGLLQSEDKRGGKFEVQNGTVKEKATQKQKTESEDMVSQIQSNLQNEAKTEVVSALAKEINTDPDPEVQLNLTIDSESDDDDSHVDDVLEISDDPTPQSRPVELTESELSPKPMNIDLTKPIDVSTNDLTNKSYDEDTILSDPKSFVSELSTESKPVRKRRSGAAMKRLQKAKYRGMIGSTAPKDVDDNATTSSSKSGTKQVPLSAFLESDKKNDQSSAVSMDGTMSVASALGARSIATYDTSSTAWRRRHGTGKDRRHKAEEVGKLANQGWLESIQNASKNGSLPYHTWTPEKGWEPMKGYEKEVEAMKKQFELDGKLPITSDSKLDAVEEDENEVEEPVKKSVSEVIKEKRQSSKAVVVPIVVPNEEEEKSSVLDKAKKEELCMVIMSKPEENLVKAGSESDKQEESKDDASFSDIVSRAPIDTNKQEDLVVAKQNQKVDPSPKSVLDLDVVVKDSQEDKTSSIIESKFSFPNSPQQDTPAKSTSEDSFEKSVANVDVVKEKCSAAEEQLFSEPSMENNYSKLNGSDDESKESEKSEEFSRGWDADDFMDDDESIGSFLEKKSKHQLQSNPKRQGSDKQKKASSEVVVSSRPRSNKRPTKAMSENGRSKISVGSSHYEQADKIVQSILKQDDSQESVMALKAEKNKRLSSTTPTEAKSDTEWASVSTLNHANLAKIPAIKSVDKNNRIREVISKFEPTQSLQTQQETLKLPPPPPPPPNRPKSFNHDSFASVKKEAPKDDVFLSSLGNAFVTQNGSPLRTDQTQKRKPSKRKEAYIKSMSKLKKQDASFSSASKNSSRNWTEVNSDTGHGECGATFFKRMTACNAGFTKAGVDTCNENLPAALYLLKNRCAVENADISDVRKSAVEQQPPPPPPPPQDNNLPTPEVIVNRQVSSQSSITMKTREFSRDAASTDDEGNHIQPELMRVQRGTRTSNIQRQLGEAVRRSNIRGSSTDFANKEKAVSAKVEEMMAAMSNPNAGRRKVDDMIESLSNTSSIDKTHAEKFLANREKRYSNRSSTIQENPTNSANKEKVVSAKVEEMMAAMSNPNAGRKKVDDMIESLSNTSSINKIHAEKFLANRERRYNNRNRVRSSKQSSTYQKSAEQIAAAKVEAMMSAMASPGLDENEI